MIKDLISVHLSNDNELNNHAFKLENYLNDVRAGELVHFSCATKHKKFYDINIFCFDEDKDKEDVEKAVRYTKNYCVVNALPYTEY